MVKKQTKESIQSSIIILELFSRTAAKSFTMLRLCYNGAGLNQSNGFTWKTYNMIHLQPLGIQLDQSASSDANRLRHIHKRQCVNTTIAHYCGSEQSGSSLIGDLSPIRVAKNHDQLTSR